MTDGQREKNYLISVREDVGQNKTSTDHVGLSPTSVVHLLVEQERASSSDRGRVGVRLSSKGERLERKVGRV